MSSPTTTLADAVSFQETEPDANERPPPAFEAHDLSPPSPAATVQGTPQTPNTGNVPPPAPRPVGVARPVDGLPAPPLYNASDPAEHQRVDRLGEELAPDSVIWTTYVKAASTYDAEMVDGWNKELDVLLIFASLFSAVVTAFLIESSKLLQPDYTQVNALLTAHLLASLANGINTSFIANVSTPAQILDFKPDASAEAVNLLWYAAMSLSLGSVLVSMLAKQWLAAYLSEQQAAPHEAACERQRRFDGLQKWSLPHIMALLPALLHISLFLFLVGLIIYMMQLEMKVSAFTGIILGLLFVAYFVSGTIAVFVPSCPYVTPLSRFFRHRFFKSARNAKPVADEVMASKAIMWLASGKDPTTLASALQSLAGLRRRFSGYNVEQAEYLAKLALEHLRRCFVRESSHGGAYVLRTETQWEASCYARTLMNFVDDSRYSTRAFDTISKDDTLPKLLQLLGNCRNPSLALLALCDHQRLLHRIEVTRWNSVRGPDGSHDKLQAGKFVRRDAAAESMNKIIDFLSRYIKGDIFLLPFAIEIAVETMGFAPLLWVDTISKDSSMERILLPLLRLQHATRDGNLGVRKAIASTLAIFADVHSIPRDTNMEADFANRFEVSLSIVASVEMAENTVDMARQFLLRGLAHFAGTKMIEGSTIQIGTIFEALFYETDRRTGNEEPWFSDSAAVTALLPLLPLSHLDDDYKEKILQRLQANAISAAPGQNLTEDSYLYHIAPRDPFPPESVAIFLATLQANRARTIGWIRDVSIVLSIITKGANHKQSFLESTMQVTDLITHSELEDTCRNLFWILSRSIQHGLSPPVIALLTHGRVLDMLDAYDQKRGLTIADLDAWVQILPQIPITQGEARPRKDLVRDLLGRFQKRDPAQILNQNIFRESLLGEASNGTSNIQSAVSALHRLELYYHDEDAKGAESQEQEAGYLYPPHRTLLPMYEMNS